MLFRISILALVALLLAGCESGKHNNPAPAETETAPARAATAPADTVPPSTAVRSSAGGNALPDGGLDIGISAAGVTIRANQVSQQTILYRLATQAGFDIAETDVPWQDVTLDIETDDLHTALVELLKQYPYQIIYEYDTDRQADTLKRVVVGEPQPTPATDAATNAIDYYIMPGVTESALSADEQAYLTQLQDPSPEVRKEAANNIEPAGIALDYLAQVVTSDPSPDVRIAAASTLGDSKEPRAVDALIMALQDENPEVLVAVIDALVDTDNRRVIPYLMPFLDNPDEDVRNSAENTLDQLNQ